MPAILSVGTANPAQRYTQSDLLSLYPVEDKRVQALFERSHVQTRYLSFPPTHDGLERSESQGELLQRHLHSALQMGEVAIRRCLEPCGLDVEDIDYLCVVTTTGFLSPGLSAHFIHRLPFHRDCQRLDVVGMGCNAGLNGLNAVSHWAQAHPGKNGLLICVEVCSAAYVVDGTMRTAVVNSLFGDGAAAALVRSSEGDSPEHGFKILGYSSWMVEDSIESMRFDWDDEAGKFSFFLDPEIPYLLGSSVERPVDALLKGFGLRRRDVRHWIVHSGGKKVIDAIQYNLGLTKYDVRHTISILRDFGNLSSGSFLFSLQRLSEEGVVQGGDHGVMITMGPGSQIETALVRWVGVKP